MSAAVALAKHGAAATPSSSHDHAAERSQWAVNWGGLSRHLSEGRRQYRHPFLVMDELQVQRLSRLLPAGTRTTLEVGSGPGTVSRLLARRTGTRAICLDYTFEALTAARQFFERDGLHPQLIQAAGEQLPLGDGSVDMVLSVGLLEHFEDPSRIVLEMVRVLRPGGLLYANIAPRKFRLLDSLDRVRPWLGLPWEPHFEASQPPPYIQRLLRSAGLKDVAVMPAGVLLPRCPVLVSYDIVKKLDQALAAVSAPLLRHLDGTFIAEALGFYYFCYGYKPECHA